LYIYVDYNNMNIYLISNGFVVVVVRIRESIPCPVVIHFHMDIISNKLVSSLELI